MKRAPGAPRGYLAWEAAGLRWLAQAEPAGGARAVGVESVDEHALTLEALTSCAPTRQAAEDFGHALAATHDAGAPAYGSPPAHWTGDGWFGPASEPLPLLLHPEPGWGRFYAEQRIRPAAKAARDVGAIDTDEVRLLDRVAERVAAGEFDVGPDATHRPARLHGDLWSGNVMWTERGVVLIDPAAHGGHRESDLAMLALFGGPHLPRIVGAYADAHPLADGWQERVGLHQLYPVLVHAILFGGGYARQALQLAARYA